MSTKEQRILDNIRYQLTEKRKESNGLDYLAKELKREIDNILSLCSSIDQKEGLILGLVTAEPEKIDTLSRVLSLINIVNSNYEQVLSYVSNIERIKNQVESETKYYNIITVDLDKE